MTTTETNLVTIYFLCDDTGSGLQIKFPKESSRKKTEAAALHSINTRSLCTHTLITPHEYYSRKRGDVHAEIDRLNAELARLQEEEDKAVAAYEEEEYYGAEETR